MLSMQHILCTILASKGDNTYLDKHASAVVFPDAIRKYTGPREYTHFESGMNGDVSYWKFPTDMKHLTPESVQNSLSTNGHLATKKGPCVLGEDTHIETFEQTNRHLPPDMYDSILLHLHQDTAFDAFIREEIDCSKKYQDTFSYQDKTMNGKEVRTLIADMEQQGIYALAHQIYQTTGIVCDQKWFEKEIKPRLERDYPADLAESTYQYMKIREPEQTWIKNKDWSHLNEGPIAPDKQNKFIQQVTNTCQNICDGSHRRNQRVQAATSRFGCIQESNATYDLELK